MVKKSGYGAKQIKVMEGLEAVRNKYDLVELRKRIKRKGDVLVLSRELKIRPRILSSAVTEGRILRLLPGIQKSKAGILNSLRTDREVKLFAAKYELNDISARKLINLIKKWNISIQKNPRVLLTEEEYDMIIGSLLGDASIRQRERNSCFRFSHSVRQKDYAKWKAMKLYNFNISEFREVKRKFKNKFIHAIDLSTKTHSVFNYYRDLFYKNGKKTITREVLSQLSPRG